MPIESSTIDQRPTTNDPSYCPQISVLVLTYNSDWQRIKATLNSVILQKGIDFEVIVSDDCSQDNHADEIRNLFRRHSFTNYQLILHEENLGTVKNLLDAAFHARSDYVKGIGQGDMLSYEYALRDVYEDFVKSGASMGGTAYAAFQEFGFPLKLRKFYHLPQNGNVYRYGSLAEKKESMLIRRDFMHGPTMIYKREVLMKYLKILADAGVKYTEDVAPWIMTADEENLSYFDKITVLYEAGIGFSNYASDLMYSNHEVIVDLIAERLKDREPELAVRIKELQKIRIEQRQKSKEHRAKKDKIKKLLGIFEFLVVIPFKIYKGARRIISGRKIRYTDTKISTEFANLCIKME